MTNNTENQSKWLMYVNNLQGRYVVPFSLQVVEGSFALYSFDEASAFKFRRQPNNSGYVDYVIELNVSVQEDLGTTKKTEIAGWYGFRAVGGERTLLNFIPKNNKEWHPDDWEIVQGLAKFTLVHFINWMTLDQKEIDRIEPAPLLTPFVAEIKAVERALGNKSVTSRGPKPKEVNDEARRRIAAGEDRELVYSDWLRARNADPDNKDERAQHKDAFRKVLSRAKADGRT